MAKITITRMEREQREGDWHDKPLRWEVAGPNSELQRFSTKRDATLYARIRRTAPDFATAGRNFLRLP